MKISIEPTGRFQSVNDQRCRVWIGKTDKGVNVELFIAAVQVTAYAHQEEFASELDEIKTPREWLVT